jgi:Protein of unknown function (DUF3891)
MIVALVENGWEIIYHRAHALLAAQIAGHWRKSESPARLYETIAAISHHDDLEREWQGDHLTPAGAPLDFTLDPHSSIEQLAGLVTSARYRSRWVAMLVSMHICFLNQDKWGQSPAWDQFLTDQNKLQDVWRQGLGIDKDEAERAYQFMHWCDRSSLILTQHQLPAGDRWLEISSGLDGQRYDIKELSEGQVTVHPWPFEESQFTVNVEAACLSQLKFEDNQSLTAALQNAPIKIMEWTFIKQDAA